MTSKSSAALALAMSLVATVAAAETTLTVATVNNNDMIVMQRLSKAFEEAHPDIRLNWVTLEENILRERLTTDISTNGGQYDIMTIGLFEAPMWGERGWLAPFDNPPAAYQIDDILPSVREGLSADGKQYALPFYAESQMTYYRKDLLEKAGLTMPEQPTWDDIAGIAAKIHDPANGVYGICLRGKPGWGENMGQITPVANSYGARWFDMDWHPQFDTAPWKEALTEYIDLLTKYGPPGATSNGYNEILTLFGAGKCGMWVDATVAAGTLSDTTLSSVVGKVGYALPPYGKFNKGNHYLWAWALAVPASSKKQEEAQQFVYWATSQDYIKLVADTTGWATVPPGTRKSTYDNQAYLDAAPFARLTMETIQSANPSDATQEPVPYRGIQFVGIPEFQAIGTAVGQEFAAAISGQQTIDQALANAQSFTEREMRRAGYIKN